MQIPARLSLARANILSARLSWLALALLVLLVLPFVLGRAEVFLATEIIVLMLFATSFNLLFGYTGLVSFGHATYFGLGAYTLALLLKRYGAPFPVALLSAPVVSAIIALVIGWFCVRSIRLYFSLLTLAFGQLVWAIVFEWYDFTGGSDGIQGIPKPEVLSGLTPMYYFVLVVVAVCLVLLWFIANSPFGWALKAIRDNPHRAQFLGINERQYKLMAFTIAGAFAGVAGALFSLFQGFADPGLLDWTRSAEPLFMSLVGGMHYFLGPVVGAGVVTWLRKFTSSFTEYWPLVFGIILLAMVIGLSEGIVGFVIAWWQRRRRPATALVETAPAAKHSGGDPVHAPAQTASSAPEGDVLLETQGIIKDFGGLRASDHVSLRVVPGKIHAIIGPNGAGKTTFFNCITGHYVPNGGRVLFNHQDITGQPAYRISRQGLTRAFQIINVFPRFTVLESVQLALMASHGHTLELFTAARNLLRAEALEILQEVGLADKATELAGNLSHGDQRTLEMAIALAGEPKLLLLDEPAAGMAPWERVQMVGLIKRLVNQRKITVLFCEHDMDIVFGIAEKITVLHQGRVLAEGTVDEIKQNAEVQAVYLGEAGGHLV
jgi:ABC-type branched-subunit amino acid transport system ATPase component/ABC-type branched-subunit amino acid transport system permease subunit